MHCEVRIHYETLGGSDFIMKSGIIYTCIHYEFSDVNLFLVKKNIFVKKKIIFEEKKSDLGGKK